MLVVIDIWNNFSNKVWINLDVLITKSCPIIRQFNDLVQIYSLELHDGLKPKLPSIVNKVEVAFLKATIQLIFNPCFFFWFLQFQDLSL